MIVESQCLATYDAFFDLTPSYNSQIMRHLTTRYHPETPVDFVNNNQSTMLTRLAARAIVLRGNQILMLDTQST